MNDEELPHEVFRTLKGFLSGKEPDEDNYTAYSATLRISGKELDFDDITNKLKLAPTSVHRKGERKGPRSPAYRDDMWLYTPPVDEQMELSHHIDALWARIENAKQYLIEMKEAATVDVFLGYRSNIDHAGIEVPYTCLKMFIELQIPFGLSIIVA